MAQWNGILICDRGLFHNGYSQSHMLHVWYMFLHLGLFRAHVGKCSEHMGINIIITMDSIIILSQWLFNGMFEYAKDGGQSLNPGN